MLTTRIALLQRLLSKEGHEALHEINKKLSGLTLDALEFESNDYIRFELTGYLSNKESAIVVELLEHAGYKNVGIYDGDRVNFYI